MHIHVRRVFNTMPPLWKVFPIVFTLLLFSITGYTNVRFNEYAQKNTLLIFYLLSLYLYMKVIYPGYGTPKFEAPVLLNGTLHTKVETYIEEVSKYKLSNFKYCEVCDFMKPERTHHCKTCKTCVLKMDHHCPWFGICIGIKNHKRFILFLVASLCFTAVIWIDTFKHVYFGIKSMNEGDERTVQFKLCYLLLIATVFTLTLVVFTGYSIYLVFKNTTTIESMNIQDKKDKRDLLMEEGHENIDEGHIYDLGYYQNWKQVMGQKWYQWFMFSDHDNEKLLSSTHRGFLFPVNDDILHRQQDLLNRGLI